MAHDRVAEDRLAVVGEGHGACPLERGEVSELFAMAADGCSGNRKDVHVRAARGIEHPAGDFSRVIHGAGVGHGADGGKAAGGCGHGAAGDRLFVGLAGLAQVNVNIDEARCDDESAGVEAFIGATAQLARRSHFRDTAVFEQEVVFPLELLGGVNEETVTDCEGSFVIHAKTKTISPQICADER